MKKGFLCILLSLLMILPLLTACGNKEADLSGSEVNIYTLYTIVDEATSAEAIRQVELSLNRILFYRLGVILDLQMVTEDEYDEFIAGKLAELEAYQEDNENNPYAENANDPETMTGDRVLEMLENGEDIVLKRPRVDVFLVRGYDDYYTLASEGKLAKLDEKLSNEGKELKSQIHTTLIDAAKVGGNTYGIPINTAIGEYTYMVFDKTITNDLNLNLSTIKTLADLEGFLGAVKDKSNVDSESYDESYKDIIPLYNTGIPEGINFIVKDGFPALVSSTGEVISAYDNKQLQDYFGMIAKYNAMGYILKDPAEDARCAVRIESGNKDEIIERLGGSAKDYEFVQFAPPIATTKNTLKNLFCIPASVVSSELGSVVKIINEINTDAELMNLLTYGIQKTHGVEIAHYELNDKKQVERIEDNLYVVDPQYIGNCFITHTLAGEDPNKWKYQIDQNKIAVPSPSLGFSMTPVEFTYTEQVENEDGTITTQVVKINEPDFIGIVNEVVSKYYPNLMNGSFLTESTDFDYDAVSKEILEAIESDLTKKLDTKYSNYLKLQFKNEELQRLEGLDTNGAEYKELMSEAEEIVVSEDISSAISYFENTLGYDVIDPSAEESSEATSNTEDSSETEESAEATESSDTEESSDVSEEESSTPSEDTEEPQKETIYVADVIARIDEYYTSIDTTKADRIAEEYKVLIASKADDVAKEAEGTNKFNTRFAELKNSDEYKQELAALLDSNLSIEFDKQINEKINEEVVKYTDKMIAEINSTIKVAVSEFVIDYAEKRKASEETSDTESSDADTSTEDASTEDSSTEDTTSDNTSAGDIFEGDLANDEYLNKIKEEVFLAIGFYVKKTVEPETDSSDDASGEDASGTESSESSDETASSDADTTESESTEADTTASETTEVESSATSDTSNDESSAEGDDNKEGGEDNTPVEVITEPYKTWLDFVIKGKVATAFYLIHPMVTA